MFKVLLSLIIGDGARRIAVMLKDLSSKSLREEAIKKLHFKKHAKII